jgi:hypothetical protein
VHVAGSGLEADRDFFPKCERWSHGGMPESPLSPLLKTARDYLDAASTRLDKNQLSHQAAGYGLTLLMRILDEVRTELDSYELAELAAVYDTLAVQAADISGLDAAAAFRALAVFCNDDKARLLVQGQPPATPEQLSLLRRRLLWITVTYEAPPEGRSRRVTEIAYRNAEGGLRSSQASLEFGYEDLPDRVRARLLASGQQAVRYQLYPASPGN